MTSLKDHLKSFVTDALNGFFTVLISMLPILCLSKSKLVLPSVLRDASMKLRLPVEGAGISNLKSQNLPSAVLLM